MPAARRARSAGKQARMPFLFRPRSRGVNGARGSHLGRRKGGCPLRAPRGAASGFWGFSAVQWPPSTRPPSSATRMAARGILACRRSLAGQCQQGNALSRPSKGPPAASGIFPFGGERTVAAPAPYPTGAAARAIPGTTRATFCIMPSCAHPSRRAPGRAEPVHHRQHPQRRHQHPLRLRMADRPTAPALPQRPFPD